MRPDDRMQEIVFFRCDASMMRGLKRKLEMKRKRHPNLSQADLIREALAQFIYPKSTP